jgi:L-threonylcarbamoyladenylate synthase
MTHEIVQHWKNGHLVLMPTDAGWALTADTRHSAAMEQLLAWQQPSTDLLLLIAEAGQLSQYVQSVPDIAWDLVDFAEKPLNIIYQKGKNLPEKFLGPSSEIMIRCLKRPHPAQQAVFSLGRAVLALEMPQAPETWPTAAAWVASAAGPSSPATVMQLAVDGTFVFLRK